MSTAEFSRREFMHGSGVALGGLAVGSVVDPAPGGSPEARQRADALVREMTLREKVGQMTQIEVTRLLGADEPGRGTELQPKWLQLVFDTYQVGSILSGGGSAPIPNTPKAWAELTNAIQRYAIAKSRLGIPVLYGVDSVHGHNNVAGATIFPHQIGLAASWDPEVVAAAASSTAEAMRATGVHLNFAPVGDLGRDPRFGRLYETFGEDPHLAARLMSAAVAGYQQRDVAACIKHPVGYSANLTGQDQTFSEISVRELRSTFLPPFTSGAAAGARSAMVSGLISVNGVPLPASRYVVGDLLRRQAGFAGFVVSGWAGINNLHERFGVASSFKDAVRLAIRAGMDMSMVPYAIAGDDPKNFAKNLYELVREGAITIGRIDESVRRILTVKIDLGLFENPYVEAGEAPAKVIGAGRDVAYRGAVQSLTLLKNTAGALPLRRDLGALLVAGRGADHVPIQMGGWTIDWQGLTPERIAAGEVPPAVTIRTGIQDAVPGTRVTYVESDPDAAAAAAREADAAVVVLHENVGREGDEGYYAEHDGNTETGELSAAQRELVAAVQAAGIPTILVVLAGRPIMMTDVINAPATSGVLMAYYPGTEAGRAVADVLFGAANPSGRLPVTWPSTIGAAPQFHTYPAGGEYDPLFGFGFGLSYTEFGYANLSASAGGGELRVEVDVTNRGSLAGADVVQVYAKPHRSSVLAPQSRLIEFQRVSLAPGQTTRVRLRVPVSRLAIIPGDVVGTDDPVVEPGRYRIWIGDLSTEVDLPR